MFPLPIKHPANSTPPDQTFREAVASILKAHNPARHPFFETLASFPSSALSPSLLGELYKRYQAAMHATRVMIYFTPFMNEIALRTKKLKVIAEDDGMPGGDTHHYQLGRTFALIVPQDLLTPDEDFGDLDELLSILDPATSAFVTHVEKLYPSSLGPWVVVEGMAHSFIGALRAGLMVHFPAVADHDYFAENFNNCIEEAHAQESLNLVASVLRRRPDLLPATLAGAEAMAVAFDDFWSGMQHLLTTSLIK